jgi:hypothetical protein
MENRSYALMTGFFTVALLVAAVLIGLWLNRDRTTMHPYEIVTTRLQTDAVPDTIGALLDLARRQGVALRDLHIQQPSLEDVFLQLTGRSIRA